MAILTEAGRTAVAHYISEQPLHMAWGRGVEAWDITPVPITPHETMLVSEVGRRAATSKQFVLPDADGEIVLPEGRFTISLTPTKYLFLRFQFEYQDAVGEDIREYGVFVGTVPLSSVPSNTKYLLPDQIEDPGRMLVAERVTKYPRADNRRELFSYVIQF